MMLYRKYFKRILDVIFSLLGIILLFPVFLCISMILAFLNKGRIFFFQQRPGRKGRLFKIIKFRTMTDEKTMDGKLLPDDARLTSFGKLIRTTSLDEIPQLFNVIKGNMSFIGPRPLMPKYLPLYNKEQFRRHDVRPGISGWAQINGRNNLSWKKKFELDVWYVDNISFFLDIKIIFLTIKKVLLRENIAKEGHATTVAFNGKN